MKLLLMTGALLLVASKLSPAEQKTAPQCAAVALTVSLQAGDDYQRRINDLTFVVRATKDKGFCWGWMFSLEDAAGHDFIYPVNPPLRFNPSQLLGCGYGQTARESLKISRELRFLLNQSDYERFQPLLKNALWPGDAPNPDRAAKEYLTALDKLSTGLLRLRILHSEVSADDSVRSAEVQAELIAPSGFQFDPTLKPYSTVCSPKSPP
jgi:hypothetical protein